MKITAVHTAIIRVVGPSVFVKIDTDEGITGLGECYPSAPADGLVNTIMAMKEHLVGQDPGDITALHEHIRRFNIFTGAQGGAVLTALSGVEMALWDIKGKHLGVPVYDLLGGKFRETIRLYADCHAGTIDAAGHHVEAQTLDPDEREQRIRQEMVAVAQQAVAQGFQALKFDVDDLHHPAKRDHWNWTLSVQEIDDIVGRVAAVRDVIGTGIDLAIDVHGRFDLPSAMTVARELAPFKLIWLEEPVPPENINALIQVRERSPVPICAGENVYSRFGLFDLMQRGAVDIVMPDIAKFGGVWDGLRVAGMAEMFGLPFTPHNVSSPLGTIAMAHVCAAIPNFLNLEFHGLDLAYWGDLVTYADGQVITDGAIKLTDAPGWGLELNEAVMREHVHIRMSQDFFGQALP
jgi:galactonate dehydratase